MRSADCEVSAKKARDLMAGRNAAFRSAWVSNREDLMNSRGNRILTGVTTRLDTTAMDIVLPIDPSPMPKKSTLATSTLNKIVFIHANRCGAVNGSCVSHRFTNTQVTKFNGGYNCKRKEKDITMYVKFDDTHTHTHKHTHTHTHTHTNIYKYI